MSQRIAVNQKVTITAMYFQNRQQLKTFPRRMEYDGTTYTFLEGLQYLIRKGKHVTNIFDMTDGTADYRLKCDGQQLDWTLVNITHKA